MNDIEPRLIYRSGNDGTIASFKELEWGTLLSKYYSSYQDIVKHPKVISEYVRLSPVELKEFGFDSTSISSTIRFIFCDCEGENQGE